MEPRDRAGAERNSESYSAPDGENLPNAKSHVRSPDLEQQHVSWLQREEIRAYTPCQSKYPNPKCGTARRAGELHSPVWKLDVHPAPRRSKGAIPMKLTWTLRNYLQQVSAHKLSNEFLCTCGDPNHARVVLLRVDGRPAVVIIPEGAQLTLDRFRAAAGCRHVEPLGETELDEIYAPSELGFSHPFENSFGTDVYLDETLMAFRELVFCPRMFDGAPGECFRVPTRELLEGTRALALSMAKKFPADQTEKEKP